MKRLDDPQRPPTELRSRLDGNTSLGNPVIDELVTRPVPSRLLFSSLVDGLVQRQVDPVLMMVDAPCPPWFDRCARGLDAVYAL